MGEYKLRYMEESTGCVYCWDEEKRRWVKICPVEELPPEIRKMVLSDKERAMLISEAKV